MPYSDESLQQAIILPQGLCKVSDFSRSFADIKLAIAQHRNTRRIVPPIFQPAQPFENDGDAVP
jgi:hypothetical protein